MRKDTRCTAKCRYTAFGEVTLTFPFRRDLVNALKDHIPYRYRDYDAVHKEWRVDPEFAEVAISLLLAHFPDAEIPLAYRARTAPKTDHPASDHFSVLQLLPTAPPELVSVAYRCLAKIHHPDAGGDPAMMRQLNEAHDALARRLSA